VPVHTSCTRRQQIERLELSLKSIIGEIAPTDAVCTAVRSGPLAVNPSERSPQLPLNGRRKLDKSAIQGPRWSDYG